MALFTSKADKKLPILTKLYQAKSEQEVHSICDAVGLQITLSSSVEILDLLRLVCVLMDALADGGLVAGVDILAFSKLANFQLCPNKTFNLEKSYDPHEYPILFVPYLEQVLSVELNRAMKKDISFSRCPECNSVFVVERCHQQWCSQRCRQRVGQRRRYVTLFKDNAPS